jgi:hypothetical protein
MFERNILGEPVTMVPRKVYNKILGSLPTSVTFDSSFAGTLGFDNLLTLVISRAEPFTKSEIKAIQDYIQTLGGVVDNKENGSEETGRPLIVISKINWEKVKLE